jgi:hypothetical protein
MLESPSAETVRGQLEKLKEQVKGYTVADLQSGSWFIDLLRRSLTQYATVVNAEYFDAKYPGLNRDAVVDRRVELAQRYAGLAGGTSAAAYSAAVVATLETAGGASAATIPAGVLAFAADLFFISRLQLRLAYDLSVLYRRPLNLEDPEDLLSLVRIAFGIKASQELQNALTKLAPEAARVGVKSVAHGATLQAMKALPVVGKYLLQRNIIKMAIPGVAIPLSAGLNYFMTGRIARAAREVFRTSAVIAEAAPHLVEGADGDPRLFLEVVALVVAIDQKTTAEEAELVNALARELMSDDAGEQAVSQFRELVAVREEDVLSKLSSSPEEFRTRVFHAACTAAAVDGKLKRRETQLLKRLAEVCGAEYDKAAIENLVQEYRC